MQQKDPLRRAERNQAIIDAYLAGRDGPTIAEEWGLHRSRVEQILNQAGVQSRGRCKGASDAECEQSFVAFAAVGGTLGAYDRWREFNPWAVSGLTLINRGYGPRFAALPPVEAPDEYPVTLPGPRPADHRPVLRWLYLNSCETKQALEQAAGKFSRFPKLQARRQGLKDWSIDDLDRLFPDLWTLNRSCA